MQKAARTMANTRPSMGVRAISDLNPLLPGTAPNGGRGDLGHGTHAVSAGKRVTSAQRTALGGLAPMSPFLPLPPVQAHEGVQNTCEGDENGLPAPNASAMSRTKSTLAPVSFARGHQQRAVSSPQANAPAPMMIRSYSMPVATQKDYEASRRAEAIRRKNMASSMCHTPSGLRTPLTPTNLNDTTMTRNLTIADAHLKQHLQNDAASQSTPRAERLRPRRGSSSEGDEVDEISTPRALTPLEHSFKGATLADAEDVEDDCFSSAYSTHTPDIAFTIHPGHLQPPSTTLL